MSISSKFVKLYLGKSNPYFENVCVVCNKPCNSDDRILVKSTSSIPLAGAEFVSTREFNVPAHKGKCSKSLKYASWRAAHLATIGAIIYCIISGSVLYMLHLPFKVFIFSLVPLAIVGFIYVIFSSFRLSVGINEIKPDKEYLFSFRNLEYARTFRELNSKYLKP